MSGFITTETLDTHGDLIAELYGAEFLEACRKAVGTTFLSMLMKHGKI